MLTTASFAVSRHMLHSYVPVASSVVLPSPLEGELLFGEDVSVLIAMF